MNSPQIMFTQRTTLITGILGQDGKILSEIHLLRGFRVLGIDRFNRLLEATLGFGDALHSVHFIELQKLESNNELALIKVLNKYEVSKIFHFAAEHGSSTSKTMAKQKDINMYQTHVEMTNNLSNAIVKSGLPIKLMVAGSSQMYDPKISDVRINSRTPENPKNYYGQTKVMARNVLKDYRVRLNLNAAMLILCNHESRYRVPGYLSFDIAKQMANQIKNETCTIFVRNAYSRVDWSDAFELMEATFELSERDRVIDLALGSGTLTSVKDLILDSALQLGFQDVQVQSIEKNSTYGVYSDNSEANLEIGWNPQKTGSHAVVDIVKSLIRDL